MGLGQPINICFDAHLVPIFSSGANYACKPVDSVKKKKNLHTEFWEKTMSVPSKKKSVLFFCLGNAKFAKKLFESNYCLFSNIFRRDFFSKFLSCH